MSRSLVERIRLPNPGDALVDPTTMATLLARGDDAQVQTLGRQVAGMSSRWSDIGILFLEPVCHALGNAWNDDRMDSTDLVIAQTRVQGILRTAGQRLLKAPAPQNFRRALVAPVPSERDLAGMTFAGIALDAAGWGVNCAFPQSSTELLDTIEHDRPDLLHLALSELFTREHRLPELAAMIRSVRRITKGLGTQILVSGRAFTELQGLAVLLGADGDGLSRRGSRMDPKSLSAWAAVGRRSPAMMATQATLLDVCLEIQRHRFGLVEERRNSLAFAAG